MIDLFVNGYACAEHIRAEIFEILDAVDIQADSTIIEPETGHDLVYRSHAGARR